MPLMLIALNEIDFELVGKYIESHDLQNFKRLMSGRSLLTDAEAEYDLLEPWIQWVSVHTGLSAREHGVFRLGDIVESDVPQVFELLESHGFSVGCVCAMNAANHLQRPAYFLPDPWTKTAPDGSLWSQKLTGALRQAINANAEGRLTASTVFWLLFAMVRFGRFRNLPVYLRLAFCGRRVWRRALFLDLFLADLHRAWSRKKRPDFCTVFLNAGAHVQHHYYLNSKHGIDGLPQNPSWYVEPGDDPVGEMLKVYDLIIGDILEQTGFAKIFATGLSQRPYDRVKYYYRLRDHAEFLRLAGIRFQNVAPRMTRDFLVQFGTDADAALAEAALMSIVVSGSGARLFGEIENRGSSLFVTLSYPEEINDSAFVDIQGIHYPLKPLVVFVAIKNGMHASRGYAFLNDVSNVQIDGMKIRIAQLNSIIRGHFRVDGPAGG